MELKKNQYVLFSNGIKEGYLEARWSNKHQAFYTFTEDHEKIFSTDVREKAPSKKRTYKKQTDISKMIEIVPEIETEKAYGVYGGSNGCITPGNVKIYYKWYAKSICVESEGKIFVPVWATK